MVSFGLHREKLQDGWLHSTGGMVSETRMIEVDYFDNRNIDEFEFNSQGWVDMTTIAERGRKIKYRHIIPIKMGEYTVHQDTLDYEVCASDGFVTFYCEKTVASGETDRVEWGYTIEISPFGDINGDGCVNGRDLGLFFGDWGTDIEQSDFNGDGEVNGVDLGILFENWKNEC